MSKHPPSQEQAEIMYAFKEMLTQDDTGGLSIKAVAGSGKTSTAVLLADLIPSTVSAIAVAFNKKNATELDQRLPNSVTASTMNSLGFRAWKMSHGRCKLEARKMTGIVSDYCTEHQLGDDFQSVKGIAIMCKHNGLIPPAYYPDSDVSEYEDFFYDELINLADQYNYNDSLGVLRGAAYCLEESIRQALEDNIIDFDDQLYMPTYFGGKFTKYLLVMVDEAQDLSPVQHDMVERMLLPKSKLVLLGDPHQAIYGFRGAHTNSMSILEEKHNLRSMPLSVSFRCPKTVVKQAQRYVPEIQSADFAAEGSVNFDIQKSWRPSDLKPPATIICRNNAPLIALAWQCGREGHSVAFMGRDIGDNIERLIKKIANKSDTLSVENFRGRIKRWYDDMVAEQPKREHVFHEQATTLNAVAANFPNGTVRDMLGWIEQIFKAEHADFTFTSGHRAKGHEWKRVYFLNSFLIPSGYATEQWQVEQENNLAYVIITRSQDELIYIDTHGG